MSKIIRTHNFGEVTGFEVGYAPVGRPLMNVIFYLAGEVLIDSGQSRMKKTVLSLLENRKFDRILLTHHHEDHSGNAGEISRIRNVPVFAHSLAGKKLAEGFRIMPYQKYVWGKAGKADVIKVPSEITGKGIVLNTIHTPGHSRDHTVFIEKNRGWLFSGDLYLGSRIRFFRADEDIYETIASLKKVLRFDFQKLFCCHNPRLDSGKKFLKEKLDFLENLCGKVNVLSDKGYTEKEILKKFSREESGYIKIITLGNVSFGHMVKSALKREG